MSTSVVEVLEAQHRRVAELFEQVSAPDADRPAALHELLRELAAHVASERSTVQPVVKARDLGDDLSAQLLDDYERMERLMVLIERRKFNSPDVPDLVSELLTATEEHAARSEKDLFPGLSRTLSPEEQQELATKLDHADDMVLSHPHPHLLSLGRVGDMLTSLVSRWDRMRDKTVTNTPPAKREGDPSMGGAT